MTTVRADQLKVGQTIEFDVHGIQVTLTAVEHEGPDHGDTVALSFDPVDLAAEDEGDEPHLVGGWHVDPDTPITVVGTAAGKRKARR